MKIKEKGNIVVVKKSNETVEDFAKKIEEQYHTFIEKNIAIDLSSEKEIRPSTLIPFETLAQQHISQNKSFVIIANIDFDEIDNAIIVVPTLQEAYDIIQMEEIERDLGF